MKPRTVVFVTFAAVTALAVGLAYRRASGPERWASSAVSDNGASDKGVAGIASYSANGREAGQVARLSASMEEEKPASPPSADAAALRIAVPGRKLIRNGEISIEVRDYEAAAKRVSAIAASFGGYVSDAQASGEGSRRHGTIVVRVRAVSFDQAFAAFQALGKVQGEHVGSTDITKAYTDLETRLSVKRDAAERIRDILKNRTARLADVLQAEKELSSLVEQIETMEGERRWYDQQVELSTISAEIHEPEAVARPSAFAPLRQALRDSLSHVSISLAAIVTFLLYALPWLALAAGVLAIARRVRRKKA